jgi:hypothetical protein
MGRPPQCGRPTVDQTLFHAVQFSVGERLRCTHQNKG